MSCRRGRGFGASLYTLLYCSVADGATVCVDEPDNFVALPEIQPWLHELYATCVDSSGQAIIISHHPEMIDFLAPDCGVWFSREVNGPARLTTKITDEAQTGLPLSELVARGWIHGA